jgi:thioesterase domain-containing protein
MAYTFYHSIDNNLYLLKYDTKNTIRVKKSNLVRRIKKLLKINRTLEQKTELQVLQEDILKLSMAAYKKYKLVPYNGNITLFRAKRRSVYFETSKSLGWKPFAKAVKIYETEGNHYTIFNPAHCRHLANMVQQCLDECNGDSVGRL